MKQPTESNKEEVSQEDRIKALSKALSIPTDEAEELIDNETYKVFTDIEATEKAEENINETLWAFNKSFLDGHSEAISQIPDAHFQKMQGELCESFNDAVEAMIDDFDHFVEDSILSDGRAHFMNTYDGEELEEQINGHWLYIYRVG